MPSAGPGGIRVIHEQSVFFSQGAGRLEGLYTAVQGTMGAVISHPHPLKGGDMRNSVVEILTESLFAGGLSTLRFNFRGVGMSEGGFDDGRGEQEDVLAAVTYLERQGIREIVLAGYSFGAWVDTKVILRRNLLPAVLVSPPIDLLPFDFEPLREKIGLMICGDQDPYCPLDEARNAAAQTSCLLEIVAGADHLFSGKKSELSARIDAFVMRLQPKKSS
jgi:alpha/beta superfamily hydrolase